MTHLWGCRYTIRQIYRDQNKTADRLANEAMDEKSYCQEWENIKQ